MKNWFKSNTTVKNAAQAGDAWLFFHFNNPDWCVLKINTQEQAPLDDTHFHGKYELRLWGGAVGFRNIPLLETGSFVDSLHAQGFEKDELSEYSHFILKGVIGFSSLPHNMAKETITTYRLTHQDRYQIISGLFF